VTSSKPHLSDGPARAGHVYYDPYDYGVDAAAHAAWKRLRDEAPLYHNDIYNFFALSRYDDVLHAILDTETFSSAHGTVLEMMTEDEGALPMMIFMDPPEHTWHRKVVNRAFTTKTVAALEDRVTRLCNLLLDRVADRDEFDFLEDYGAIIPPTMILALLGFPEGHEEGWRVGIDRMFHMEDGEHGFRHDVTSDGPAAALVANPAADLFQMLPSLIAARRQEPTEDLMSVLVHTELDEPSGARTLTDEEIFSFVLLISVAGTETVARLLGWTAVLLDRHPDQRALLVDDPTLIPNAIEECLRYEAPSPVNGRWLTKDLELHGQRVPAGSKVLLLNGSGNRDERHFAEPDRFDVTRTIDRHLSFGYGAHFCIGAALARLEGHIALREILNRYHAWDVDDARAEMVHTSTVRGYAKVPIRVTG
jgi:cytochrome P450